MKMQPTNHIKLLGEAVKLLIVHQSLLLKMLDNLFMIPFFACVSCGAVLCVDVRLSLCVDIRLSFQSKKLLRLRSSVTKLFLFFACFVPRVGEGGELVAKLIGVAGNVEASSAAGI